MKLPRFSTSTLLLSVTVAAISFGGIVAWERLATREAIINVLLSVLFAAPVWVPLIFVTFAIARKTLNVRIVIAFALAEAAAVAFARWLQLIQSL